jgi:hypothetical protein
LTLGLAYYFTIKNKNSTQITINAIGRIKAIFLISRPFSLGGKISGTSLEFA